MKKSSLLLAGGLGTRLNGYEKALLPLKDGTFIENTLKVLDRVSDEVIISFRDEKQLLLFEEYTHGRETVVDILRNVGPLAGMLEGFKKASYDYIFVAACDMPYLNGEVVELLFDMCEDHDAVIPVNTSEQKEPLHAVYRRKPMLAAIENSLREGNLSVMSPVSRLDDVLFLESEEITTIDKGIMTFTNINTPGDMDALERNRTG
ncbi:molybdenum cofactor guanylyltransferase [Methanolobus sp. ZRKC2]|uniref:molybdenum cofactor guanylyltransferase n=1 Tax=Methanolobus sp. ZRKC2 TaxID=3125783 RepID=UPI00325495DC